MSTPHFKVNTILLYTNVFIMSTFLINQLHFKAVIKAFA